MSFAAPTRLAASGGRAQSRTLGGYLNRVVQGDCVERMRDMPACSIDFVLTDPPYLVNYRSRDGRRVANDNNDAWLQPAFAEMYRVLKDDSFCVSFYGWNKVDAFMQAWRAAGFRIVGHLVFTKSYASSTRFLKAHHEMAYLLAKGEPSAPPAPIADVISWSYTGNRLHPTQKPLSILRPFIEAFCPADGVVLDPFCGSGSTLVAAKDCGRHFVGIDLEPRHCETAGLRLAGAP